MEFFTIQETQRALLDTLSAFHKLCERNGIRYSLDCGTLLGAVRHGGFIPWDDDADVLVPRPDYELLISHPEWIPAGFHMRTITGTADLRKAPFVKFCNMKYRAQEPALNGIVEEYLWVDVFPADAIPDNDFNAMKLIRKQARTIKVAGTAWRTESTNSSSWIKKIARSGIGHFIKAFSLQNSLYELVASRASSNAYGTTSRVGNVSWFFVPGPRWTPIDSFDSLIKTPFEDKQFWIIPTYEEYLTGFYGNYMALPSEASRIGHRTLVWKV